MQLTFNIIPKQDKTTIYYVGMQNMYLMVYMEIIKEN